MMMASMLSMAERVVDFLSLGNIQQLFFRSTDGFVLLLMSVRGKGLFYCMISQHAKLGSLLIDMRMALELLGECIHPISYGTAMLDPSVLERFEQHSY